MREARGRERRREGERAVGKRLDGWVAESCKVECLQEVTNETWESPRCEAETWPSEERKRRKSGVLALILSCSPSAGGGAGVEAWPRRSTWTSYSYLLFQYVRGMSAGQAAVEEAMHAQAVLAHL